MPTIGNTLLEIRFQLCFKILTSLCKSHSNMQNSLQVWHVRIVTIKKAFEKIYIYFLKCRPKTFTHYHPRCHSLVVFALEEGHFIGGHLQQGLGGLGLVFGVFGFWFSVERCPKIFAQLGDNWKSNKAPACCPIRTIHRKTQLRCPFV